MNKRLLSFRYLIYTATLITFIDQVTKSWAFNNLSANKSIIAIPHLLQFRLVKNTGAAFSLLSGSTTFLSFISLIVAISIILLLWKTEPIRIWKGMGLALILGGTLGNGIDRFRLGFVNDFLELLPINFPIFNIADISINIGIILLLIDIINQHNATKNFK